MMMLLGLVLVLMDCVCGFRSVFGIQNNAATMTKVNIQLMLFLSLRSDLAAFYFSAYLLQSDMSLVGLLVMTWPVELDANADLSSDTKHNAAETMVRD